MSFALDPEAIAWAAKARAFANDELMPYEVEAEMNAGRLPPGVAERHERLAVEMGLPRLDAPKAQGGLGLPMLTQVAVYEQLGRVTNALCWCYPEAQGWMFEAFSADQIERYAKPMMTGDCHVCYAITEEDAGSDPSEIATTAHRDGDHYVITGEKWHVTSYNLAETVIVQAVIAGGDHDGAHALFFCPADAVGPQRGAHAPIRPHLQSPPSGAEVRRRARAVARPHRRRGRRHGLYPCLVPP